MGEHNSPCRTKTFATTPKRNDGATRRASALTSVPKSVQDITLKDDSASKKAYWTLPRPAHGTQGTKMSLRANGFEIKPFSH